MATWQRWKILYGGMKKDAFKRLRELKKDNARLNQDVADITLDRALLEETLRVSGREERDGYRTVWRHQRRNVWEDNHKRLQRMGASRRNHV
jgi:hypothetical protein